MAAIDLYGADWCGYCIRASRLLKQKGVEYRWIDVDAVPEARGEMRARGGGMTIPQIFIDDEYIGGCDELYALERAGKLDALLA